MTDTITLLHYAAIVVLEAYLIYSEVRLWKILEHRSDARTALKNARQALWRSVRK